MRVPQLLNLANVYSKQISVTILESIKVEVLKIWMTKKCMSIFILWVSGRLVGTDCRNRNWHERLATHNVSTELGVECRKIYI